MKWLAFLSLFIAAESEAALRYAIIFDESVEGKTDAPLAVESSLSAALLARGATLIDEAQSRKIRSVTSAGDLVAGRIHRVVTTLDADLLVAGISSTERATPPSLVKGRVSAFETHATLKLIAIDSGEIVDTITISETAYGATPGGALAQATRQTGARLAERILDNRAKAHGVAIEVSIEALPNLIAARELGNQLSSLADVDSADIVHASTSITEYRVVMAAGGDVESLAAALESAPLEVTAYADRTLRARYDRRAMQARAVRSRGLRIGAITVHDVFPARAAHHRKNGIGEIELINDSPRSLRNIVLRARIPGFTRETIETNLARIGPHQRTRAKIRIALDEGTFEKIHDTTNATLIVEIAQGESSMLRKTAVVNVLDRSAIDWKSKESVAAFVTSRDPVVRSLAEHALDAIPSGRKQHALARSVALFELLRHLRYQKDAVYPGRADDLDEVRLPIETLARGAGDCDDLAVLYAALAEAVGVRAALVLTPGHVMVAVDTETPEQAAQWNASRERMLEVEGRAWIPIEATLLGGSFDAAWRHAAQTLGDHSALEVIVVRDAWADHPPVSWRPAVASPEIDVASDRIEAQLSAIERAQHAEWETEIATLDRLPPTQDALNRRGLLMLSAGRIDEAEAAFSEATLRADAGIEAINNLANLQLMHGSIASALKGYQLALARSPTHARVRLNAAIAARAAGDEERFAEEITECLETAAGRELVRRFLASLEGFETARGAASTELRLRALAASIRALSGDRTPTLRASEDRLSSVEQILFWLF